MKYFSIIVTRFVMPLATTLAMMVVVSPNSRLDAKDREPSQLLASDEVFKTTILPMVETYCLDCHDDVEAMGDLSFESLARPEQVLENRDAWVKAFKLLSISGMPPAEKKKRPTRAEYDALVEWLDLKLNHCDCEKVDDVGRETIHRLNRTEYNNTIRDLLGVDVQPADDFPSDDVGHGFSNMADVLSLSPLLLEKYVDAAEKIAAAAIRPESFDERKQRFSDRQLKITGRGRPASGGGYFLYSAGAVYRDHEFAQTGEYLVRFEAMADQAGPESAKMRISIDGKPIKVDEVKGHLEPAIFEVRRQLTKGSHRLEAAFINDYYRPEAKNRRDRDRNLTIRSIEIQGPIGSPLPASHKRIVFTQPSKGGKSVAQAAREIFTRFLPQAFRRPVSSSETNRYVALVESATKQGDTFERGIQIGVQAMLVSPHFLFRVEIDDNPHDPDAQHQLTDFELATRLSYFLWSTMPDQELFRLAKNRKLHQPKVLDQQITRMLKDPKADALVDNFASQWLNLSNLVEVEPDTKLFPEFTPELRADMIRETKLFARSVFREDRSILDFLDAKDTFVNERLARHYGINGVKGEQMRRVALPPNQRMGVLTHGSILTLTSNPDRSSLVRRGDWIVNNVLGIPLPDTPDNVPSLDEAAKKSGLSLREQLALHRESPNCSTCHDTLDPLGFGLDNFDAIGRWRQEFGGKPVDSKGIMPSGESFSGPVELTGILKKRKKEFTELVTRKMLTYALGRGLELPDSCAVDEIVADLQENDYRFSRLVRGIARSRPFLMRRGDSGS